jgi:hypothetical protein
MERQQFISKINFMVKREYFQDDNIDEESISDDGWKNRRMSKPCSNDELLADIPPRVVLDCVISRGILIRVTH